MKDTNTSQKLDSPLLEEAIVNRVANSKLRTFDLEEIYPEGKRILFDVKDWLFQELILKEKDFRDFVKNHDWSQYKNSFVAVTCSVDAIIPSWAFMLVASELTPIANKVVIGDLELLETVIYQELISFVDFKIHSRSSSLKNLHSTSHVRLLSSPLVFANSGLTGSSFDTSSVLQPYDLLLLDFLLR